MSENALHLHPKGRAMVSRRAVRPACPVVGYSLVSIFFTITVPLIEVWSSVTIV